MKSCESGCDLASDFGDVVELESAVVLGFEFVVEVGDVMVGSGVLMPLLLLWWYVSVNRAGIPTASS